jgi:hypothetical protein
MDDASVEIDVLPAQAADLARPQAGEHRRDNERPPARRRVIDQRLDFRLCGEIHALRKLAGVTLVLTLELDAACNVLRDQPLRLCEGQYRF